MTCSTQVPKSSTGILLLLLLLSGDIETNPGPKDKKGKDKTVHPLKFWCKHGGRRMGTRAFPQMPLSILRQQRNVHILG